MAEATAATLQVLKGQRPPKRNRHRAPLSSVLHYLTETLLDADRQRREEAARLELEKEEHRRQRTEQ